jgi:hypothetical protein
MQPDVMKQTRNLAVAQTKLKNTSRPKIKAKKPTNMVRTTQVEQLLTCTHVVKYHCELSCFVLVTSANSEARTRAMPWRFLVCSTTGHGLMVVCVGDGSAHHSDDDMFSQDNVFDFE